MTDKVQKIREEVERLKLYTMDEHMKFYSECAEAEYNALCKVEEIIDSLQEEPASEDLEEAARNIRDRLYLEEGKRDEFGNPYFLQNTILKAVIMGAQWKKEHLWKPADGDDLPEYDREVIVLVKYSTQRNIHDEEYFTYRVAFGHRPNPNGWDGKSITTGNVEHYTPKTYDKGGWNAPDIAYWLDIELPKEIEL